MSSTATVHQFTPKQGKKPMPSDNGFVRLWRDIRKQPYWRKDLEAKSIFVELIMSAQHETTIRQYKGAGYKLNAGQMILSSSDISKLSGVDSVSKIERSLKKFEKLGQISRQTIKEKNRPIGQIITLLNYEKWQKIEQPSEQPVEQPEAAVLQVVQSSVEQCIEQPVEQHSNNVLSNKDQESMTDSTESVAPALQDYTKERLDMFESFWKEWRKLKRMIGNEKQESKQKAKDKFLKIFTAPLARKLGLEGLAVEVDACLDVAFEMHAAMHKDRTAGNLRSFHPIENTQVPSFLGQKIWRQTA